MAGSESELSPASKRLKTIVEALTPGPRPRSRSKGKEKVMVEQDEGAPGAVDADCLVPGKELAEAVEGSRTCGICFSEEGQRSIRGRIDSCDHYFCFVCIMEWSKVESRCPLCKQRFGSIRRALLPGLFDSERVVGVPVRNQVYHPYGIETEVYADPYAETTCSECHSTEDEDLLLLCDLCDTAAHTYCVGLGAIVPEGDWFCDDCTVTKLEHSTAESDPDGHLQKVNNESDDNGCSEEEYENIHGHHADESNGNKCNQEQSQGRVDQDRSSDIIREIVSDNLSCDQIPTSSDFRSLHRQRDHTCSTSHTHIEQNEHAIASRNSMHERASGSEAKINDQHARTVRRCRDVNVCIRRLRENWDSLRSGSLSFESSLSVSNTTGSLRKNNDAKKVDSRSSKKAEISCTKTKPTDNSASNKLLSSRKPQDVDRAWKMMEAAMSVQKRQSGIRSKCQISPNLCKVGISKEINGGSHFRPSTKEPLHCKLQIHDSGSIDGSPCKTVDSSGNSERQNDDLSLNNMVLKIVGGIPIHHKQKQIPYQVERLHSRSVNGSPCKTLSSSGNSDTQKIDFSSNRRKVVDCVDAIPNREKQVLLGVSLERSSQQVNCSSFPDYPKSVLSGSSFGVFESPVPVPEPSDIDVPGCEMVIPKVRTAVNESSEKLSLPSNDSKKSEIQSLVKLNLKLLQVVRPLGAELFKKIAKVSTHTILAACGMEHSKSSARPFPNIICKHAEVRPYPRSNLMPTACRKCFYSFVKDVVNDVASLHS